MTDASTRNAANRATANDTPYHAWLLALAAGVLLLAAALRVNQLGEVVVPLVGVPVPETCVFKRLTGYGCPGCGLTRCFISVAHGDFALAWQFNPAGLVVFLVVAAQIPYRAMQIWRIRHDRRPWHPVRISTAIAVILAVLLLAQWLWRWIAWL